MRTHFFTFLFLCFTTIIHAQDIKDDFEGNGNISAWVGDDCGVNARFANPKKVGINTSNTVLAYTDNGGLYANVRFDMTKNLNLTNNNVFTVKIYVDASLVTGNSPNQVSLKLQNGTLPEPWSTQTEIIKPIVLNQWQTISFNFATDNFININSGSPIPKLRNDFDRILIQINGENNTNKVTAYIDDFNYEKSDSITSIFNKLVWADEFDTNGKIDTKKWYHQTRLPQGGSWFNGEVQHYTSRIENSFVENGILNVVAKKESFTDQGFTKQYTSARLNSKFAFKYGRVEFRARMPVGVGTWPAVWLLGKNINERGAYWDSLGFGRMNWPACGEIDILEHWGSNQNFVQSAMHTTSSFGNTVNKGGQIIPTASTDFHVYAMEWTAEKIVFSVNGNIHYTYNPSVKNASTWPFDAEQYFLINFAIQPNIASNFTQDALEMDYIRVYQEKELVSTKEEIQNQPVFYPNPVSNELNIVLDAGAEKSVLVNIYSIDGKLVFEENYNVNNNSIQLNNLAGLDKGIYIITYQLNNQNYRFKIVKD